MAGKKLTEKQRLFVEHYLQTNNGTEAARRAGYKGSDETLWAVASENLRKPQVKALVEKRYRSVAMTTDEVLEELAGIARGFDPTKYIREVPRMVLDREGIPHESGVEYVLDLEAVAADGYGKLIKAIRNTNAGPVLEFYDRIPALTLVGKNLKLFVERTEHSGPDGGPIPFDLDEWKQARDARLKAAKATPNPDSESEDV